jgi:RNA polymerase sigma factor (sigma-70 family)
MKRDRNILFDHNSEMIYRVCENIARGRAAKGTVNGMTVNDYCQAALMGVWRSLGKYRADKGELRPWVIQQARRAILDEIRKCDEVGRSRRADGIVGPQSSLESLAASATGGVIRELTVSPRHADRLMAAEAIAQHLAGLDPQERMIVYLVEVLDHADFEAAAVLDLPVDVARDVHAAAMAKLRGRPESRGEGRGARGETAKKSKQKFALPGGPCGPLFTQGSEN